MTVKDDILGYIRTQEGVVSYRALSRFGEPNYIGVYLGLLTKEGLIVRVGRGLYRLAEKNGASCVANHELTFGFEIEAEYNNYVLSLNPASYHDSQERRMSKNWKMERDGSLYNTRWGETIEFISVPTPFSKVGKLLESFENTIKKKSGKNRLDEVLHFNSSTGAHVHIGLRYTDIESGEERTINIKDFVQRDFLRKAARRIKQRVKNEMPAFYESFKKDYYRKYAQRFTQHREGSRYQEFNYATRIPTIEYRSPHLHGITTWSDFSKFYRILTETMNEVFEQELREQETPFLNDFSIEHETRTDEVKNTILEFKEKLVMKNKKMVV